MTWKPPTSDDSEGHWYQLGFLLLIVQFERYGKQYSDVVDRRQASSLNIGIDS